jgi:hypothetical protein
MGFDEREAHEWLCANLAPLRVRARESDWVDKLEREVQSVRDGGSAVRACRSLGYRGTTSESRGTFAGSIPLAQLGIDPVVQLGEYVCPKRRCGRRESSGSDGAEPRCALFGGVMDLRPLDEPTP